MNQNKVENVVIRIFNEKRDMEVVKKLEENCEMGSKKGVSMFTSNMMGHPLCRIRLYLVHVMLVAEMLEGELVGVVRGCIKCVGTGFHGKHVKMGCISGLRVSTKHRRMGIGIKLVKSMEEWLINNGAHFTFLAAEENNVASRNMFTLKCNYSIFSSLVLYIQPITCPAKDISIGVKIEKLNADKAISLYKSRLSRKELYTVDIDAILKEDLSLGTWVSYFRDEDWVELYTKEKNEDIISSKTPTSWAVLSIWNTCEAYKFQIRKSNALRLFHATLTHANDKILNCLNSFKDPFGFLFLYGLDGEGERLGELMMGLWSFVSKLAENVKDCKVIMTELGVSDPLRGYMPQGPSMSCVNDLWYVKKVKDGEDDMDEIFMVNRPLGNVFVDPRDF